MIKVTIQFRGPIVGHIKEGTVEIEIQNGLTIIELLGQLMEQETYLQTIWKSPTEIDRDSMILCNEVDIGVGSGLNALVNDGDVLTILPLVHGG
jgi:molybdopterin converting factor small subunit